MRQDDPKHGVRTEAEHGGSRDGPDAASSPVGVEEARLWLRGPEDVLARIPYTLGFHPSDCLIVVGVGDDGRSNFALRFNLPGTAAPPRPPPDDWPDLAHRLAASMVERGAGKAILVAYTGSAEWARGCTGMLAAALEASGIDVLDVLWVDGGRWWSLVCADYGCCPTEGRPYDPTASRVAAESVYHGDVALPDEATLRRSIAPVRGRARHAMRKATARMDAEACRRYLQDRRDLPQAAEVVRSDGKAFLSDLLERCFSSGHHPTDDEVAWAAMYLYHVEVRDSVWLRMTEQTASQHVQLWREVGCRALPPYHVAPLTLLAFAAWLSGNGLLANCAIERVLASDPDYSMAHLVRDVVAAMVPTSVWPPEDAGEGEDEGVEGGREGAERSTG